MYSLAVNALKSPPTRSTEREISCEVRVGVPLNSRCSRKWLTPLSSAGSSREPDADPDPGRHRKRARHEFGGDGEAGVELSDSKVGHRTRSGWAQRCRRGPRLRAPRSSRRGPRSAAVAAAIGSATTGFAAGAEVAELAGELGVERVVEADGHGTISRRGRPPRRTTRTSADDAACRASAGRSRRSGRGSTTGRGSG